MLFCPGPVGHGLYDGHHRRATREIRCRGTCRRHAHRPRASWACCPRSRSPSRTSAPVSGWPGTRSPTRWLPSDVADEAREDAMLVLSELVSNAVKHAAPLPSGEIAVRWSVQADVLHIEITDGGASTRPHVGAAALSSLGGRGLDIVRTVSTQWGVTEGAGSVTVWAECRCHAGTVTSGARRGGPLPHRWTARTRLPRAPVTVPGSARDGQQGHPPTYGRHPRSGRRDPRRRRPRALPLRLGPPLQGLPRPGCRGGRRGLRRAALRGPRRRVRLGRDARDRARRDLAAARWPTDAR